MLLSMTILCAMSAAMFYASRVPAIYNEVFSWFGKEVEPEETKRTVHLTFLLFTYSSPLLLACLLGLIVSVLRWFSPGVSDSDPDAGRSSPWDEG
jgi:predicted permease